MQRLIDLTGMRFGRLVALRRSKKKNKTEWLCVCDCGNEKVIEGGSLRGGRTKSCGCLNREVARKYFFKHGYGKTKLVGIRSQMIRRCYNPKTDRYPNYGGRGIIVCKEWLNNPRSFYEWSINNGFKEDLTIDRIDNDGNYEPSNCRWATQEEQANNKQASRRITYNGETKTQAQWAKEVGIDPRVMQCRRKSGWSEELIVATPLKKEHTATFRGVTKTIKEWSIEFDISYDALNHRINRGWSEKRILDTPVRRRSNPGVAQLEEA